MKIKTSIAFVTMTVGIACAQTPLFVVQPQPAPDRPLVIVFKLPQAPRDRLTDRATFLSNIHQVENPTNTRRPGAHGELGPYQFKAVTWYQHTTLPFRLALDQRTATAVAVRHYEWIRSALAGAGMRPTDYLIAVSWNRGVDAALHTWHSDYAQRVVNLCAPARGSGSPLAWISTN